MWSIILTPVFLLVVLSPAQDPGRQTEIPLSLSGQYSKAREAMQAHRFKEASELLREISRQDPKNGEVWFQLGVCYLRRILYGRAIEAFEKAFDLDYQPAETSYQLAFAQGRRHAGQGTLEWLEKAAALGFNRPHEVRSSNAFAMVRNSPEFQVILSMIEKNQNPCEQSDQHSRFDFWLGSWEVYTPAGSKAGENRIEKDAHGCLLLEDWKSVTGGRGRSLTFYDTGRQKWRQIWVDHAGSVIEVEGVFDYATLRLEGRFTGMAGVSSHCRVSFHPLADGRVHQKIERSSDGRNWYVWFEGLYVRVPSNPTSGKPGEG